MKKLSLLLILVLSTLAYSQKPTLTAAGFAPVTVTRPDVPDERLIELAKSWPFFFNNGRENHDFYDVKPGSFKIDSFRDNAFFYRNVGEPFQYRIRYTIQVSYTESSVTATFIVREIYAERILTQLTLSDFFTPEGRLKEDYRDVKPSLEATAFRILRSFFNFISG
jgi:hypothetical protein